MSKRISKRTVVLSVFGIVILSITFKSCIPQVQLALGWNGGDQAQEEGPGSLKSHAVVKNSDPVKGFLDAYKTPIEFYGKVVDQHGDPVAGASVLILPHDNAYGESDSKIKLTSDASGCFSVKGLRGLAIGVQTSKDGYLTLPDMGLEKPASAHLIEYGLDGTKGARFKDPNKPTLFILHKLGNLEPMVYVEEKRWRLPVDGTPRNIALDDKNGKGPHQIEFRFATEWANLPKNNEINFKQFNWKLEARIPGGGFVRNGSDYAFEAPESGYEEKIVIDYPKSASDWENFAKRRYFVKFQEGTYARIRFEIAGNSDNGPLSMTSWMNLKPGSRNLASERKDNSRFFDK